MHRAAVRPTATTFDYRTERAAPSCCSMATVPGQTRTNADLSDADVEAASIDGFRAHVFMAIAERAPVPVVATSIATGEVYFSNQAANDRFNGGVSAVGLKALDFYESPQDRAAMLAELARYGALRGYHLRMRHGDGTPGDYLVWMSPSTIDDRRLLLTYMLDVTEQKAAEAALSQRNHELELILGNVGDGVLTIDALGRLLEERSAVIDEWFGVPVPGMTFAEYAAVHDAGFASWFELGWDAVIDRVLPLELCLSQLPTLLRQGQRFIKVSYAPIANRVSECERLLIVMSDVTQAVQREHAETAQRELLALFDRGLGDRAGVEEFFRESETIVGSLQRTQHVAIVLRLVHTLKGNATAFGLKRLADACEDVEAYIQEHTAAPPEDRMSKLCEQWQAAAQVLRMFLRADKDLVEVSCSDLEEFTQAVHAKRSHDELLALMGRWSLEPVERRLRRLSSQAVALAQRLGKGSLVVLTDANGVRLNGVRWAGFWTAFAQALRNAVDHGIETAAERLAANKSAHGTLQINVRLEASQFVLELADDGRGIDWNAISERAKGMGLPAETPEDLELALFAEGVTTSQRPSTLYSGRGVGMSALRDATEVMGGRVSVYSEPGSGTTLRFVFPESALN